MSRLSHYFENTKIQTVAILLSETTMLSIILFDLERFKCLGNLGKNASNVISINISENLLDFYKIVHISLKIVAERVVDAI